MDLCMGTLYIHYALYDLYIYIYMSTHICVWWVHIENHGFLNHPFMENWDKRAHGLGQGIFHVEIATIYKIVGYIIVSSHETLELYPNDMSLLWSYHWADTKSET